MLYTFVLSWHSNPAGGSTWKLIKFAHIWEMLCRRTQREQRDLLQVACAHTHLHALTDVKCRFPVQPAYTECLNDQTLLRVSPGQQGLEAFHTIVLCLATWVKGWKSFHFDSPLFSPCHPPPKHCLWVIVNVKEQELIPRWHFDWIDSRLSKSD